MYLTNTQAFDDTNKTKAGNDVTNNLQSLKFITVNHPPTIKTKSIKFQLKT